MAPIAEQRKPFFAIRQLLVGLGLLLLSVTVARAQEPLTAAVDRTTISSNETVTLTITVNGLQEITQPRLPELPGFLQIGFSSHQQTRVLNGQTTLLHSYSFVLQPTTTGDLLIGPIEAVIDGQLYTTEPIQVQVVGKSSIPLSAQDPAGDAATYVEAVVDEPAPFQGEQILYTFRLYRDQQPFRPPIYEAPEFNGFWSDQEDEPVQYRTTVNGISYEVIELYTALFPTSVGTQVIGPAALQMRGNVLTEAPILYTEPITVSVQPLPPTDLDSFYGAVGQFEMQSELDATQFMVNEPVTLRLTFTGSGNMEGLPQPEWPELAGWRTFDTTSATSVARVDGRLQGSTIFERLMIPEMSGETTVPAIAYTYFDPETEAYVTLTSEPQTVTIAEGEGEEVALAPVLPDSGDNIDQAANDIRYIKAAPATLSSQTAWPQQQWYWLLWLLPLTAVLLDVAWQWRRQQQQATASFRHRARAQKRAQAVLNAAQQEEQDPYQAILLALHNYLNDKLEQPVQGLTQQAFQALLQQQELPDALVRQTVDLRATSEMGRFGPDGAQAVDILLATAVKLIARLEEALPE